MDLIPHPFPNADPLNTLVLLDPVGTEKLRSLHNDRDDIAGMFNDEYLRVDNTPLDAITPPGVIAHGFTWKDTI